MLPAAHTTAIKVAVALTSPGKGNHCHSNEEPTDFCPLKAEARLTILSYYHVAEIDISSTDQYERAARNCWVSWRYDR